MLLKKEIKEICQNLLFDILLSWPNFININPQTLIRKNVSGTGSLTLNLPTNAPAKKLTEHLFNPFAFFGKKKNKLRPFFN